MKRNLFYLHILCAVLCLTACGGHKTASSSNDQEGDTLIMRHAKNLTVIHYDHYTAVKLRNPWDTLKTLHTYILIDKTSEFRVLYHAFMDKHDVLLDFVICIYCLKPLDNRTRSSFEGFLLKLRII